ncbi:MAG: hypothetical protein ACOVNR_04030 [Chitinophagaceae bacterium]
MSDFLDDKELQELLREHTDNMQMFPSDSVWLNIQKEVQPPTKWPALTVVALFILLLTTLATVLNYPPEAIYAKQIKNNYNALALNKKVISPNIINKENGLEQTTNVHNITMATINNIILHQQTIEKTNVETTDSTLLVTKEIATIAPAENAASINNNAVNTPTFVSEADFGIPNKPIFDLASVLNTSNLSETNAANDSINTNAKSAQKLNLQSVSDREEVNRIVTDYYKQATIKNHWSLEIYATPTVSYRSLVDNKARNQFADPLTANATRYASNQLKHKPALGLEFGIGFHYKIDDKLSFVTGLQFNSRQYFIDAFQDVGVATFAILQNNRIDSINIFSRFANTGGNNYNTAQLDNRLYQFSVPIGLNWQFVSGKKWGLAVGGSIQPTFTLNKNVYVLSTDYKYYAEGSQFFRKWNINSSLNLQLSYQLKQAKIYISPQIRYQHLPTYNQFYPIKEYRYDYGVRMGIIKPL